MHILQHPQGVLGLTISFPNEQSTFSQPPELQLSGRQLTSPIGGKAAKQLCNKQITKKHKIPTVKELSTVNFAMIYVLKS